jgi:hypothetical protein
VRDWLCLLSPWFAFVCLIIWDTREKRSWRTSLKEPLTLFTGVLAFGTIALAVVAVLQWETLEKSDLILKETLAANKAGQRAFVFLQKIDTQQIQSGQTTQWFFLPVWENNGTTQTKDLIIKLVCARPFDFETQEARSGVFGPRQVGGNGACLLEANALEEMRTKKNSLYMAGLATYRDVFDEQHMTRFCRKIDLFSDPRIVGSQLVSTAGFCPDLPDCADEECKK